MAVIFDVQRFSTHDGPGIRTVVFFKGCPLRCAWCSNPESQSFQPEILYNRQRCVSCYACLDPGFGGAMVKQQNGSVKVNRAAKAVPGLAGVCPSLAIRIAGRELTAEETAREVMRDAPFFAKSAGGVTFSGGEPLSRPPFVRGLTERLVESGVGVAIETCLAVPPRALASLIDLPILWLADLKHVDPARFKQATGGELAQVNANMTTLAASGADLELRIPLVPGFNADDASIEAMLGFAAGLPNPKRAARRIDFLPYHELALGKYSMLDRECAWKSGHGVDRRDVVRWEAKAASLGFATSTGG
ncbi:MAG TPA: glycyl-radical enzyme activating protein [Spirochaetia bacterium]|nr:glycyl-radical enzyme activating protein [Spirochaetia bacterium]